MCGCASACVHVCVYGCACVSVCACVCVCVCVCAVHRLTPVHHSAGIDALFVLSEMVRQCNIRERFNPDDETWPPDQPKNFTPLVLVRYQNHHCMKQDHITGTCDIDRITSLASNQSVQKDNPKLDNHELFQEDYNKTQ